MAVALSDGGPRLEALPPLVPPGLTPTAVRLISKTIHTLNKEDQGV